MHKQTIPNLFEMFGSSQELTKAINLLPDPTLVLDNKGYVFAWNDAMAILTGVKANKIIGKKNYAYSIPFYDSASSHPDSQTKDNTFSGEGIIILNGEERTLWATAKKIYDKDNHLLGAIETVRDITHFKKTEKKLLLSEEKYAALVEKNNDGIIILQGDGIIKYVNPAICELTGYKAQSVINKKFSQYIAREYRNLVLERYNKRLLGQKTPNRYEIKIIKKNKKEIIAEANTSRIVYNNKPAMMTVIRDITKRKLLENKLEASEDKLEHVFNHSQDGILLVNIDNRHICMCNKAICKMLGYTKKELLSSKIDKLHQKKSLAFVMADFTTKKTNQAEKHLHTPMIKKDKTVFYVDIDDVCIEINNEKFLLANIKLSSK